MLASLPALAADAVAVAASPAATAESAESSATWYGWQPLMTDAASISLIVAALRMNDTTAAAVTAGVGALGYVFGGPAIHWQHDRELTGYIDFTMRLGVPLVLAQLAMTATNQTTFTGNCSVVCGSNAADNAFAGAVVGIATSMLVDAVILSWDPARTSTASSARAPRLQWAPTASATRGGAIGGVGGSF